MGKFILIIRFTQQPLCIILSCYNLTWKTGCNDAFTASRMV